VSQLVTPDGNIFAQHRAEELLKDWRLTPATLAHKLTRGAWIPKPFLMKVSLKIASAIARGNGRLIVSWPPRHGKSELITVNTPLWIMENFPKKEIVISSYGADLSTDFGRKIRDALTNPDNQELMSSRLRRDSKRLAKFQLEGGTSLTSVGLGGPITGRGADVLLIDDYIKEIKEALSQVHRDYVYNWFTTTAMSRLEPGATVIIVATRWHRDDLIGRLLRDFPGEWEHICIPAIAGENDQFGRAPGEPLFPERQPLERLEEQRRLLGSFFFNAIYQQNPQSEDDKKAFAAWLKFVDVIPSPDEIQWCRAWDMAGTFGQGDYTSGVKVGYNPRTMCFYVDNVIRKRLGAKETKQLIRDTAEIDGVHVHICLEQEPGSAGKAVIEHYTNDVLPEFQVSSALATKTKYVRAHPSLAAAEAGKVYLVKGLWNEAFLKEFDNFPCEDESSYDDQVDAYAIAFNYLTKGKRLKPTWGRTFDAKLKGRPNMDKLITGVTWR